MSNGEGSSRSYSFRNRNGSKFEVSKGIKTSSKKQPQKSWTTLFTTPFINHFREWAHFIYYPFINRYSTLYMIYIVFFGCCHDVAGRERESYLVGISCRCFSLGASRHGRCSYRMANSWESATIGSSIVFFHAFSVSLFGRCRDLVYINYIFLVGPKTILW